MEIKEEENLPDILTSLIYKASLWYAVNLEPFLHN